MEGSPPYYSKNRIAAMYFTATRGVDSVKEPQIWSSTLIDFLSKSLKTDRGTQIYIPLGGSESLTGTQDDVEFVDLATKKDTIKIAKNAKKLDNKGIKMNFNFEFTPDATAEIQFNKQTGDVITANGIGTWSDSSNGGATQHSFTYQFVMPSLTTLSFTSAVGTISGSKSGNTTTVANFGTSFIPGATLTLTAANGTSFPSSSSTGSLSLTAVQVADAQAPTPEPSTFALIGPALLGLGALTRRRQ